MGRKTRNARATCALLGWLAQTLGIWLGCFWLDNVLHLPSAARWLLLVGGIIWPMVALARFVLRRYVWQVRPDRTARELETQCGIRDNTLINACQLESTPGAGLAAQFARRTVDVGQMCVQNMDAAPIVKPRRVWRMVVAMTVCGTVWVLYSLAFPRYAVNAWLRFTHPLADVPPIGAYDITLMPTGRVIVPEGSSVSFRATIGLGTNRLVRSPVAPALYVLRHRGGGDALELSMQVDSEGLWRATFENVQEPFVARVQFGDSWSSTTTIDVRRRTKLSGALFKVTPPSYTGLRTEEHPGPPAGLTLPEGSHVEVCLTLDRNVEGVWLQADTNRVAFSGNGRVWQAAATAEVSCEYHIFSVEQSMEQEIAHGSWLVQPNRPPVVTLLTDERNRTVWPSETVGCPVAADDCYGVREMTVTARQASREHADPIVLGHWSYEGPPGRRSVREQMSVKIDPAVFESGETYLVEAQAWDFAPRANMGRSAPMVLRVHRPQDAVSDQPGSQYLLNALQQTIEFQRRSLGLTRNLQMHLDEALQADHLQAHHQAIEGSQSSARKYGHDALKALQEAKSDVASRLQTLVDSEMGLALDDIARLTGKDAGALSFRAASIASRQAYILSELLSLMGHVAALSRAQMEQEKPGATAPPAPTADETMRDLRDLMKDFEHAQKRILQESNALLAKRPEDLTDEEKEILGQLAREEQKWADALKDKLNDMAKNALQDFSDGSLASQMNSVWQDISKAAADLYAKKLDLAVPREQNGLENAEKLVQNIEKWLSDRPDYIKWSMEEPPATPDAPLAELPSKLEDITGDLLDKEESMAEEIEDVTSSWIDSIDKGAGWDASDGPFSSMSAKGITGNTLPNQMEIGGRSGEGRSGRSNGQMVQSTAEGKEGRQTPTRVTPTPFESGSVKDTSKTDPGGATGGGKLSGFAGKGLLGPAPPPRLDQMQRLAGKQMEIRQAAEKLSLQLRRYALPSGNLEDAVAHMRDIEKLAQANQSDGVRRAFHQAVDSMREARDTLRQETVVQHEQSGFSREESAALWTGLHDDIPVGYEDLVSAYYRRLAEAGASMQ